jgi:hypothetical protein
MCDPVTLTIAAVGIAGAGVSAYQGQQQAKETKKANQQAKEASDKQLAIAEQEINKKDARNPDISDAHGCGRRRPHEITTRKEHPIRRLTLWQ